MTDQCQIPMTPNPVYEEVKKANKEQEASTESDTTVSTRKTCSNKGRNIMVYIVLPSSMLVLLSLVVAVLVVVTSSPFKSLSYQSVPSSCAEIVKYSPQSLSGYYNLRSATGSLVLVYCNMSIVCSGRRGWMKVVEDPWYHKESTLNSSICETIDSLFTQGVQYNHVCGRIKGSTRISYNFCEYFSACCAGPPFNRQVGIDESYLAGFSITHGKPRQHIWSAVSFYDEQYWCSNIEGSNIIPKFVGTHYSKGQCGSYRCDFDFSYFTVSLSGSVSDNIELRSCSGIFFYYGNSAEFVVSQINGLEIFVS